MEQPNNSLLLGVTGIVFVLAFGMFFWWQRTMEQHKLLVAEKRQQVIHKQRKHIEEKISATTRSILKWLEPFYDNNGSVLADMPDGGTAKRPEDLLRQYLEYITPRLRVLRDKAATNARWQQAAAELIDNDKNQYMQELFRDIKQQTPYFTQTCPQAHKITTPPTHSLTQALPKDIKVYAWAAFNLIQQPMLQLTKLLQDYRHALNRQNH